MNDSFVHGVFFGALVLCIFMLNFPADKTCVVSIGHGNGNVSVTHVTVGKYRE